MKDNFQFLIVILFLNSSAFSQNQIYVDYTIENCNSLISVTPSGGFGPYEFEWSGPSIDVDNFYVQNQENTLPGTYSLTVSDMLCQSTEIEIEIICPDFNDPLCGIFVAAYQAQSLCGSQQCDGFIDINLTPSYFQYDFKWIKDGQIISTNEDLINACEGDYTLEVRNQFGCLYSHSFSICCCSINFDFDIEDFPFVDIGIDIINNNPTDNINIENVCGYDILGSDGIIGQITHTTNSNSMDGAIDINIALPTNELVDFVWTYNGSYYSNELDLENLNPGVYCLTIDYGCTDSFSQCFKVRNLSCSQVTLIDNGDITPECETNMDGEITLTMALGVFVSSIEWDNGSTNEDLQNLSSGEYCVTVTDSDQCIDTECFNVGNVLEPAILDVDVTPVTDNSLGSISIQTQNNTELAIWDHGAQGLSISELTSGVYCVTLIGESSNCTTYTCVTVTNGCQSENFDVDITGNCITGGTISLNINSNNTVNWFSGDEFLGSGLSITDLEEGNYCAQITAGSGYCEYCYDIVFDDTFSDVEVELDCQESTITFIINNNEGPFYVYGNLLYEYYNADYTNTIGSNSFTVDYGSAIGFNYNITDGCSTYSGFENLLFQDLEVSIPPENIEPCYDDINFGNPQVSAIIEGGTAPYDIEWSSGQLNTSTILYSESGQYCITVTDDCGGHATACVNLTCTPYTYGGNGCSIFGIQASTDCPCLVDCNWPIVGIGDGADIELDPYWPNILGTTIVTVFDPYGNQLSTTSFYNSNGEQYISGDTEIDVDSYTDNVCSASGVYTVSIYADWLNQESTCLLAFSCPSIEECYPFVGTWFGGAVNHTDQFTYGCYQCEESCVPETSIINDLYYWASNNCNATPVVFGFEPADSNDPCTGGGKLLMDCPCFSEPIVVTIPPNFFSYNLDIDDPLFEELFYNYNSFDFPCENPTGFCVFDAVFFMNTNIPLLDNGDYFTNDVVAMICADLIPDNPPSSGGGSGGGGPKCEGGDKIIFIEDDDPCLLTYYCADDPDVIYEIEAIAWTCVMESENGQGCMFVEYCSFASENDCVVYDMNLLSEGDPLCDVLTGFPDPDNPDGPLICPSCIEARKESTSELEDLKSIESTIEVAVYPNPATDNLSFIINYESYPFYDLKLYNTEGKVVLDYINQKEQIFTLDVSDYTSGIYFARISSVGFSRIFKINIQ